MNRLYKLPHAGALNPNATWFQSEVICGPADDPLAGLAAKWSLLTPDEKDRISFQDFCKCAELIAPNTESVKRRPRE